MRHCPLVTTLALANCPLITDVSLAEIATNLPRIRYDILRPRNLCYNSCFNPPLGCTTCIFELFSVLPNRSLDICGCSKVSDNGICILSKSCHRLELLDLTSTGVGHKRLVTSVLSLLDYLVDNQGKLTALTNWEKLMF